MLIFYTGFDFLPTSTGASPTDRRAIFSSLGWNDFPSGSGGGTVSLAILADIPRFGYGKYFRFFSNTTATAKLSRPFPNGYTASEMYMGCAVYVTENAAVEVQPYFGVKYFGLDVMRIEFGEFGQVILRGSTGILWSSPAGVYFNSVWHYVEIGFKLATDSTGWATIKIDGKTILALINTPTALVGYTVANAITFGSVSDAGAGNTISGFYDDVYICDETGPDNNTFLGNVRVQALLPDGNSGTQDFLVEPITNTNWQSARNTLINDTAYVYSDVVDDEDRYTIESMVNTPTVFGVQVTGLFRQDDATQRTAAIVIDSNGVVVEGPLIYTPSSYAAQVDLYENDPDTGVAWLPAAVNNLLVGPKVKS